MSNVIQNALKFTHNGGRIQVRGTLVNKHIDIDIEDECGGLLSEKEIFQPFIQGNENQKGLGLGLTIAHRAIFLCHGTIEVHNLPGKGCIFKFTLPKKADSERLDAKSVA